MTPDQTDAAVVEFLNAVDRLLRAARGLGVQKVPFVIHMDAEAFDRTLDRIRSSRYHVMVHSTVDEIAVHNVRVKRCAG